MSSCFFKDIRHAAGSEVYSGIHQFNSDIGDFIPSGTRDSYDQSMPSEQAQHAIESGGMFSPFGRELRRDDLQAHGQIRSTETLNEVFSAYDRLKECLVFLSDGIEPSDSLIGQFLRFAKFVQLPVNFHRVIDWCQGLKIGLIRPDANFHVSFQTADSFRHGDPIHNLFITPQTTDTELPGTVNNR